MRNLKNPASASAATWTQVALLLGSLQLAAGFFSTWDAPLAGVHAVRQADTLFAGWSYCTEHAEFLRPRVAHRGNGTGVNIGEFPLASAVFSLPCRVTGEWSEGAVKLLVILILILNAFLWGTFVRRRWPDRWPGWNWFLLLWIFNTHALLHFTIALPDPLALCLVASAGLAFLAADDRRHVRAGAWLVRFGGVLLFVIAFGMRPYFIPLLFLVIPRWRWSAVTFALCVVFYFVWYKWWILQSEFAYYATDATSFAETVSRFGEITAAFFEAIVRNAANLFGLAFAFWAFRDSKDRLLWGLLIFACAMVLGTRAPMIMNHKYYLGAAMVVFTILMVHGAKRAPGWMAFAFLLVGIVNVQHHWRGSAAREAYQQVQDELAKNQVAPEDRIAVYIAEDSAATPYLYRAKRVGWSFVSANFKGVDHCPAGAKWAMFSENDRAVIRACTGFDL